MKFTALAAGILIILITGCANKDLIRPGEPINSAYDKSMGLYERGKYADAANGFDIVTRMGRGTNYARDAQFFLAESYYNDRQYILAASEYERFISYYPQDERRVDAEYKRALCYYEQSPRYRLDQTSTRQAIELFQLFNTNYPDSEYVLEAADKIDELRNKLARKTYEAANFYLRTRRYLAATIYYDQTIDQYPESTWAMEALIKEIETYIVYADNSIESKQAERYQKAIDTYEKFLQLFPQSSKRGLAEEMYNEAAKKLADAVVPEQDEALGQN